MRETSLYPTLDLLLQATDRMRAADEVWLAVPATRRGRDCDPRVHRLCRLVDFSLISVNAARGRVEVLAELAPARAAAGGAVSCVAVSRSSA